MCNVTPVMGTAPPVHPVRECVYNEAPVMDTAPPGPPAEVRAPPSRAYYWSGIVKSPPTGRLLHQMPGSVSDQM